MTNPTISNRKRSSNPDYVVETETQGDGSERQVVKVAEMPDMGIVSSSANAPLSVSIGAADAVLLASNLNRKGVVIVNDSANIVYLSFGATALINKGIRLNANGGSFTMQSMTFTTAEIRAIASGAGSNICVQEFE
jgi:hypothetical protein